MSGGDSTLDVGVNDGTSSSFLASIDVRPSTSRSSADVYIGHPQYVPWPKAYGGDTAAQAVSAASRTVDPSRVVSSFHAFFVCPVDVGIEIEHEVTRIRDGRGISTRRVVSYQNGVEVFTAIVSFVDEGNSPGGDLFSETAPVHTASPEELPSAGEYLSATGNDGPAASYWSAGRSFDLRHDPAPVYSSAVGADPSQIVWVRASSHLPGDQLTQRLALAYVCDYTILEPSLRVHGLAWDAPGLVTASIDHSMWFHRPVSLNSWIMYAHDPIVVRAGRGLNRGRFFTADGIHIATVVQEGVIRTPVQREAP